MQNLQLFWSFSEYIEEIVDADEKVGVFLHHKEIANFVKEEFPSTLLYTGAQRKL